MGNRALGFLISFAAVLALLASPTLAEGPGVAVIVNSDNPVGGLTPAELRKIYTNNMLQWPDGTPIRIYDLVIQSPLRGTFSREVLGRSPSSVAEEWAHLKITNQAKNPPLTMKSERLIIRRVSREKGSIGYVSMDMVEGNDDVRVVTTFR